MVPAEPSGIATAINALGLDLYREQIKSAPGENVLLSPYSIGVALAETWVGADSATRAEMQRVLHLPADSLEVATAYNGLAMNLAEIAFESETRVGQEGRNRTPIQLSIADRLYIQQGFTLRPDFVQYLSGYFASPPKELDFRHDPIRAHEVINDWVSAQTHDRIRDLLPVGQPTADTLLVLVNALYLRAGWEHEFAESHTRPAAFHLDRTNVLSVPMMQATSWYGWHRGDGYTVVTLPCETAALQFVLIVPDQLDGLGSVEAQLTAESFGAFVHLAEHRVSLYLPRFKLEPATRALRPDLQALGMNLAFNVPAGTADFSRMAPIQPNRRLALGNVFHKTWLSLDEHGIEAAAATSVVMLAPLGGALRAPPEEVRADHPFLFAIQHVESGACLFLGRVTDPR